VNNIYSKTIYVVPMSELGKTIPTIPNTLNHQKIDLQVFRIGRHIVDF